MKILIGGDFVINKEYSVDNISQEVLDFFNSSDYNIVNLEAPVTKSTSKIIKTGPHLNANRESTLSVLKALNIDLVTLANNHVLDYDQEGVLDTIAFCKENAIETVGAGQNKIDASKAFYLKSSEGTIAIVNIAENEWASATETTAGANGMDLIDNVKQIQEAKSLCDFVFVIVHGGHEYYNLPSPRMQKQYRFYVDHGADIVIGHHTHCINGKEMYKGAPIFYSLGNLLFTESNSHEDWYLGLILELELKDGEIYPSLIPITQAQDNFKLQFVSAEEYIDVHERIKYYSSIINNRELLLNEWHKYSCAESGKYLRRWSPVSFIKNPYLKALLNKSKIKTTTRSGLTLYLNLIRCESHLDLSKEIINRELRKNET